MQFIFWQNILSIHQSAFLRNLAEANDVTLVVKETISQKRLDDGWSEPNMGNTHIIFASTKKQMMDLINNNRNAIHVFSGLSKSFRYSLKFAIKRLVLCEPYNFLGIKGLLRRVKYSVQFMLYGEYIDGLMHTGNLGYIWFRKAGFSDRKMYHWGYFTENIDMNFLQNNRIKPALLFVGSIDERKNILYLVDVLKKKNDKFEKFTIAGKGYLKIELVKLIKNYPNIKYVGGLPNNEIKFLMQNHDTLLLPSIFDGWGAVINEALQNGMRVVCSENCGASTLIQEDRGEVFYFKNGNNLEIVLDRWLAKAPQTIKERNNIANWCKHTISGKVAAKYFEDVCNYIFENKGIRPVAPWLI